MLHRRLSQSACAVAVPARAQESSQRQVMIGAGAQLNPAYPGADHSKISFLPDVPMWRTGEAIPVETPDEGKGFSIIGQSGGTAFGPALTFAPQRSATAVPGLPAIGFGVELGVFAETYLAGPVRLRAELRHGIGAHRALTADLAADLVLRRGNEGLLATIGPRLRWGSAKYNRAYFWHSCARTQCGAASLPARQRHLCGGRGGRDPSAGRAAAGPVQLCRIRPFERYCSPVADCENGQPGPVFSRAGAHLSVLDLSLRITAWRQKTRAAAPPPRPRPSPHRPRAGAGTARA